MARADLEAIWDEVSKAPEQPTGPSRAEAFARGAAQGATLGFMDELAGIGPSRRQGGFNPREATTPGGGYREARDAWRAGDAAARSAHPLPYVGGMVAGGVASAPLIPGAAPAQAPGLGARMVQAGKGGAAIGGVAGLGFSDAPTPGGVLADTAAGAVGGAVVAPALTAAAEGGRVLRQAIAAHARRVAEDAARRSTGATQVDVTKLTREHPQRPQQIGQALLEENIRLRSPQTIKADARTLARGTGQEIGGLIGTADKMGATFDLAGVVARARRDVLAPIASNPLQQPTAERLSGYLDTLAAEAAAGPVSASRGHAIRMQLDAFLRGTRRAQDPESTFAKEALNAVRGMVSDELGASVGRTGLGAQWTEANRRFGLASDIGKLAKKGIDRQLGNRQWGFAEQVAGVGGAGPGFLAGGAPGAALGYLASGAAAWAGKRYASPVTARVAHRLAQTLQTNPGALGPYARPLSSVATKLGPEGLAAAYQMLRESDPTAAAVLDRAVGEDPSSLESLADSIFREPTPQERAAAVAKALRGKK